MQKILEFIKDHYKLILLILLVLGVGGYWLYQRSQPEQTEQVFEQPQFRDITKTLEVSGIVDAKRKAQLRFIAGGKITYLGAQEGDWVKKWQTIATIDQRDLQKRLDQTLNLYMKERWDFESAKDDFEDSLPTLENRRSQDKNQWDLENSVLDVELQTVAISNTVMSAPFAGVLVESPVDVPQTQVLASDYFELIDPESLIFRAEVDEEDVAQLEMNQKANIILDAYDTETIPSQIEFISYKSAQTSSGTVFAVEFPLSSNPEGLNKYRLGMNGDAEIELATRQNVLTIPIIATRERDNQFFVDVQTANGETTERQIEVGLETDDYIEVISGLSENDYVLIPQAED